MKKQNAILGDPLVIGLSLLSALLLLLSAKLPWWHVIGMAEPSYVRTARFFSLLPAFGACLAIALPRRRASIFVIGGLLATLLPGVIILLIVTRDPDSIGAAVYQTDQANRLINDLTRTSLNAEVPWTERVALASDGLQRSDYTFVDGVESALHFAKGGWYAGCLGGLTLLLAAWAWDGEAALGTIRRCRWVFGAAGLGLALGCGGPLGLSLYYWNQARSAQESADYGTALYNFRLAARWDGRLAYDRFFHFNLGRLYQMMGLTQEPDYWAWRGDLLLAASKPELATLLYREHIASPYSGPALRLRSADLLAQAGAFDYGQGRFGEAAAAFQTAQQLDSNDVQVLYGLALCQSKAGNYAAAILNWQRLIAVNENVGLYRYKYFVSADSYRKVISARAWSGLAWCYHRQHNEAAALACLSNSTNGSNVPTAAQEQ